MVKRLLIVGYGSIGQRHLHIARKLLPEADIRVMRHQYSELIPECANGVIFGLNDALAYRPDAVVICNPSTFHMEVAQPFAEAGSHLLVEKPLAASMQGVAELLTACADRQLVLMTAYNLRFMPSLQEFRRLIQLGCIGKVISVRCEIGQFLPYWRPEVDYQLSVSASRSLGGGVLLELSHEIDYLRWIFGEIVWTQASLTRQSNLAIDVEDTAHLILGFEPDQDGRQLIANLNMDFVRHDTTRQCFAIGDQGSLRWNGLTGEVEKFTLDSGEWVQVFIHSPLPNESYTMEWQHFLGCIQKNSVPLVSGRDGLAVLTIIEAARQSSISKGAIWIVKDSSV